MRRAIIAVLVCAMLLAFASVGSAADMTNERDYKPLDLVVVMDSSGSMRDSDTLRTAPDAVRMLANMMPAADSRVGIISFNTQAVPLTTDANGDATLIPLKDYVGVETVRDDVASVAYKGGTGIGNSIFAATELLRTQSSDEHTKAIILFTDGVNDFFGNKLALSDCDSNEVNAIKWAKDNNCCIYCVGYNFVDENGKSSMGENGEGLTKLKSISDSTGGKFKNISSISEIEQLLIEFLADVCDLNYKTITTIPGDGKLHECQIAVSPSVVEANIRIAGGAQNSISNGTIKLFDPDGNEVELRNSGSVRFDRDATAASIKIMLPKTGNWLLTVEGISGEDIHVGLLEHFKMNLTSQLTLPDDNPEGVAYTGDVIGIKAWLSYDGALLTDTDIYDAVTKAEAICVSRANPENKKVVTLTRDGLAFTGSFTIPADCFYDITVRLDWDTVYREDTLTVHSDNKPLELLRDIEDIKVNRKKSIQIKDLYSYVTDAENDPITVSVTDIFDSDVCTAVIDGDALTVTGVKGWWADTLVTVTFADPQGNTVGSTFTVSVGDPWATVLVITLIVLVIAAIVLFVLFAFRSRIHLFGKMRVCEISEGNIDAAGIFTPDINGFSYVNPNVTTATVPIMGGSANQNTVPNNSPFGGQRSTPQSGGVFGQNSASGRGTGVFGQNSASGRGTGAFGQNSASSRGTGVFGQNSASGRGTGVFGQNSVPQSNGALDGKDSLPRMGGLFGNDSASQGDGSFRTASRSSEIAISNGFNEAYNFGGKRIKKISLEQVLNGFLASYTDYMARQLSLSGGHSSMSDEIKAKLSSISVQTSKMFLKGTVGGKAGARLAVDKKALKKHGIKVTTPHLAKNSAELNYCQKGIVTLEFNIITGKQGDKSTGINVRIQLERN